jgi:hypothetical protein
MANIIRNTLIAGNPDPEFAGILIKEALFPIISTNLLNFYKRMSPPLTKMVSGKNKFTWVQIDQMFAASNLPGVIRNQIAIKVTNPTDFKNIDIQWMPFSPANELIINRTPTSPVVNYYIFEKSHYTAIHTVGLTALGLVSVMGSDNGINRLYIIREDLTWFPDGGGGPPYAGIKIPNI